MADYILNPTLDLQDTVQTRGLDPNERDPHDYLQMVSKTFSSYKETSLKTSTISYIHGFTIDYEYINKTQFTEYLSALDIATYLDINTRYHIIRINPGACFVDDQFIEIDTPVIFLFEAPTETRPITQLEDITNPSYIGQKIKLFKNLKYKVVIEYKWLKQFPVQKARIKIVVDEETYDSLNYPYLTLGVFNTDDNGNIIKSDYEVFSNTSENIINDMVNDDILVPITLIENNIETLRYYKRGIDPQHLSSLYINNFKSLFNNLQTQMYTVFNEAGLSQSNFILISANQKSLELVSGMMVYFDQRDKIFKAAQSSRQKTDRVVGLYLYDSINDQHIIFINGLINLDPDNVLINMNYKKITVENEDGTESIKTFTNRYNLTYNHPLVNLEVGNYYYLEDDNRYYTSSLLMYDTETYVEWDTRGYISTRRYPGAVKVGYAFDRTKILLDIDHSNEIDWNNAVELYGNHKLFKDEYLAVNDYYKYERIITKLTEEKNKKITERNNLTAYLGTNVNLSNIVANIVLDSGNNLKILDITKQELPDYITFFNWFSNYILIDRTPVYDKGLIYDLNISPIIFSEPTTDPKIIYFKNIFCKAVAGTETIILDTVKNIKSYYDLILYFKNMASNIDTIFATALLKLSSDYSTKNTSFINNELNNLVLKYRYMLLDDPNNILEDWENTLKNMVPDLKIKYTDENQADIIFDPQLTPSPTQNKIDLTTLENNIKAANDGVTNSSDLYFYFKNKYEEFLKIKNKIDELFNKIDDSRSIIELKIGELEADILGKTTNITNYTVLKTEASNKRNKYLPLSLDIFYLSNYERKRFNYTYLVDRLRYEFELQNSLKADAILSQNKINTLYVNNSNDYDKLLETLNLDRINKRIEKNLENITNYTNEINLILIEFGKTPITLNDKDFIYDNDLINENPKNYRFGVDFGPVGTNDERYLVNEAFFDVCFKNWEDYKMGLISNIPSRIIPAIYNISGSGLIPANFIPANFKTLSMLSTDTITASNPYVYLILENYETLCYVYDNKIYVFDSITNLPAGVPAPDYNTIHKNINHITGDIIKVGEFYYVYRILDKNFTKLEPEALTNEEISRFVREARVKSINEKFDDIVNYVNFMNYFINKETLDKDIVILESYINDINNFEIVTFDAVISATLPIIDTKYESLIEKTNLYFNKFEENLEHLNILITILHNTKDLTQLTSIDITDNQLVTYDLTKSFRTESIEIRSNKLNVLLNYYKFLIIDNLNSITFEIKKYRDINILQIVEIQNEFNN